MSDDGTTGGPDGAPGSDGSGQGREFPGEEGLSEARRSLGRKALIVVAIGNLLALAFVIMNWDDLITGRLSLF